MFVIGIIYAWSILKAPLQEEFQWSASELALNFYTDDVYVLYRRYDIRSVAFENSCKKHFGDSRDNGLGWILIMHQRSMRMGLLLYI